MANGKYLASMDIKKNEYGAPVDFESVMENDPGTIRSEYIGDSRFAIYIAPEGFTGKKSIEGIFTAKAQIDQAPTANFYRGLTGTYDLYDNTEKMKEKGIPTEGGKSLCICSVHVSEFIKDPSDKIDPTFELNNDAIRLAKRLGVPFLAEVPTDFIERLEGEKREVGHLTEVRWSYPSFIGSEDKRDISYLVIE